MHPVAELQMLLEMSAMQFPPSIDIKRVDKQFCARINVLLDEIGGTDEPSE